MSDNSFDTTVKKSKNRSRKSAALAFVCIFLIAVLGLYFCTSKLFFVKKIVVKNVSADEKDTSVPYTSEEMLSGLGINIGDGLYSFNKKDAQNSAKYNLPYIKEIKISRRWPSTLVAKAELEKAAFYMSVSDELYILSDGLKVLEKTTDAEKIELGALMLLKTGKVDNCIVGEMLGIDSDLAAIISELTAILEENSILNKVEFIDVSDKFDISLMYESRFEILLGDSKNLKSKIEFMKRIIDDRGDATSGGTIDVSDEESREAVYKKFG